MNFISGVIVFLAPIMGNSRIKLGYILLTLFTLFPALVVFISSYAFISGKWIYGIKLDGFGDVFALENFERVSLYIMDYFSGGLAAFNVVSHEPSAVSYGQYVLRDFFHWPINLLQPRLNSLVGSLTLFALMNSRRTSTRLCMSRTLI